MKFCFCECSRSRLRKEVLNDSKPFPGCSQCRRNWALLYQRLRQKSTRFLPVWTAKLILLWYLSKVLAMVKMDQRVVESYWSFGGVSVPARVYLLLSLHSFRLPSPSSLPPLSEHGILLPLFSLPLFTPHRSITLLLCKHPLQHPSPPYKSFICTSSNMTLHSACPPPPSPSSGSLGAESCRDGAMLLQQSQPLALSMWEMKSNCFADV